MQVLADKGDGPFGQHVAEGVLALVHRPLARRQRERRVVHRRIRLDGVRQRVDAAVGRHLRRTAQGEQRIDDGHARAEVVAQHAHLHLVLGVGQHGGGRHLRAGPGRGRQADQRHDRAGNLAVADVHAGGAAVRQHHGGDLGQVHVAAAAEAEDAVGSEVAAGADRGVGGAEGRLRLAAGEQFHGHPRLAAVAPAPHRPARRTRMGSVTKSSRRMSMPTVTSPI